MFMRIDVCTGLIRKMYQNYYFPLFAPEKSQLLYIIYFLEELNVVNIRTR